MRDQYRIWPREGVVRRKGRVRENEDREAGNFPIHQVNKLSVREEKKEGQRDNQPEQPTPILRWRGVIKAFVPKLSRAVVKKHAT